MKINLAVVCVTNGALSSEVSASTAQNQISILLVAVCSCCFDLCVYVPPVTKLSVTSSIVLVRLSKKNSHNENA